MELDYPEKWIGDHYNLQHKNGIRLWMANEEYGFKLEKPYQMHFSRKNKSKLYKKAKLLNDTVMQIQTDKWRAKISA